MSNHRAGEFLINNRTATIATVSPDGGPEAAFVYYVTDDYLRIYVVISTESRKTRNILQNNRVALCISSEAESLVLQIEGFATMLDDPRQKAKIAEMYLDTTNKANPKSLNAPPIMKIPSESGFLILVITVTHFKFSDFSGEKAQIIEGANFDR